MDIILMIFFSFRNYRYAINYQQNGLKWGVLTALAWIFFEITGSGLFAAILNLDLTNTDNLYASPGLLFSMVLFGVGCAYLGYLIVKRSLYNKISEHENHLNQE